jgi:hypothetical protein
MKSYSLGIGPVNAETARTYKTVEYDKKDYLPVGKALNTKEVVDVGSIVRVKVDEVKKNKDGFSLFSAKLIEIPEVTQPDNVQTLEQLSTKTKKSLGQDALVGATNLKPFKLVSGLRDTKGNVKKGIYITDDIHGTAEVIAKSDFDGFTIYGFKGDTLMQKNALHSIDLWKDEMENLVKSRRSELRLAIKNEMVENYADERAVPFAKLFKFAKDNYPEIVKDVFNNNDEKVMDWMKSQDSFVYVHPNKFTPSDTLEKDVEDVDVSKVDSGQFSIMLREDDNIDIILEIEDTRNAWTVDITELGDIYDLFGKSQKFPAIVAKKLGEHRKRIDSGELKLGVQREGYHEYKINGDKFETRFHVRVVPLDEKKTWVVWTGKKQEMLDLDSDENLWDITKDKYADLTLPT